MVLADNEFTPPGPPLQPIDIADAYLVYHQRPERREQALGILWRAEAQYPGKAITIALRELDRREARRLNSQAQLEGYQDWSAFLDAAQATPTSAMFRIYQRIVA